MFGEIKRKIAWAMLLFTYLIREYVGLDIRETNDWLISIFANTVFVVLFFGVLFDLAKILLRYTRTQYLKAVSWGVYPLGAVYLIIPIAFMPDAGSVLGSIPAYLSANIVFMSQFIFWGTLALAIIISFGFKEGERKRGQSVSLQGMSSEKIKYYWGHMVWLLDGEASEKPNISVAKMLLDVGATSEQHFHNNCYEFLVVERGEVVLALSNKAVKMSTGDNYLVPPDTNHCLVNEGSCTAVVTLVFSENERNYNIP